MDEHEAASIVAGMHSSSSKNTTGEDVPKKVRHARKKRNRSSESNNTESKRASSSSAASAKKKSPPIATTTAAASAAKKTKKEPTKLPPEPEEEMDATAMVFLAPTLKPAPYFYYSDHSLEGDDDPLTPIIAAGSVPTFPASEYKYIIYKYILQYIYLFLLTHMICTISILYLLQIFQKCMQYLQTQTLQV